MKGRHMAVLSFWADKGDIQLRRGSIAVNEAQTLLHEAKLPGSALITTAERFVWRAMREFG